MTEAPWQLHDWLGRLEEAAVVTEAKIAAAVAAEREECAATVARLADKVEACDYYGQGQIEAYRKAARVLRSRGRKA